MVSKLLSDWEKPLIAETVKALVTKNVHIAGSALEG
jgi:hypothetical protein